MRYPIRAFGRLYTREELQMMTDRAEWQVRNCAAKARSWTARFWGTSSGWKDDAIKWRQMWHDWRWMQNVRGFR